jgi:uncharacterized damage-inducible protein DinB
MGNQAILGEMEHEMKTTRRLLERVPSDKLDWQPHSKSMTMRQLSTHIAEMAGWMPSMLTTKELDFGAPENAYKPAQINNSKELVELFDANVKKAREALAGASDQTMMETWTLRNGPDVIFSLPKAGVVRAMILNHLIHHRGQLSVYLRLNDVPVPSIYGPSADEQSAPS